MEYFDTMDEDKSMTLCISVVVCCNLVPLLFCGSGRGALLDLLVVSVVDIHLLLDLGLKSVLQRLRVPIRQCFGWVVLIPSVRPVPLLMKPRC
jgi:hypothetical protein